MGRAITGTLWERFRRVERKFVVALIAGFAFTTLGFAQQSSQPIIPDGNTRTNLATSGNVTNITTSTISGNNAYNSFSVFNVNQGNVVNLYLPNGTDNLLNLVNSQTMNVDGILNSIKDGQIGGNVFFADPFGIVVGKSGVVNVGSFTALTPTQNFINQFFDSPGNPSSAATSAILNGTVPISPDGLISIKGTINAAGNIGLYGGAVSNAGVIQSGAIFSGSNSNFSDVVNTNGLQNATSIAVQNGNIVIQAAGNVENAGSIATNGGNNLNAGNIDIQAGGNVNLDSSSLISASGRGANSNGGNINIMGSGNGELASGAVVAASGGDVSGDGGSIDFSAKGTVNLDGGVLKAGAANGTAGTVTLDPSALTISANDEPNDGSNLIFTADNSITVNPGVTISSSWTSGNSGNISFTAPQITVGDGAYILANATNGFSAGDISMTATDSETAGLLTGAANANASINIGNATIEGNNITLSASAAGTADNSIVSVVTQSVNDLLNGLPILGSAQGLTSTANATITVGGASGGSALINAAGSVSITSDASSSTKIDNSGQAIAFAYGDSTATSSATVANTATIQAGGSFDLKSSVDNELDIKNDSTGTGASAVAVSYGKATSTSTAQVDGNVTAPDVSVESENTNSFATEASDTGSSNAGAGGGVGVAVSNYNSNANTNVDGSLTATTGNVDISSSSTNSEDITRSESEVNDDSAKDSIESAVPFLSSLDSYLSSQSDQPKPESNPSALGIAAAVTVANSMNKAATTVTGNVTATSGDVNVDGTATDNPQISAAGSAGGSTATLGGAVAVGNYNNEADAYIQGSAVVTAQGTVAVNADAEIPDPFSSLLSDITNAFNFSNIDFTQPVVNNQNTGWGQALSDDITNLSNAASEVKDDIDTPGNVLTSFTNTGVSGAESGSSVGIGGSVDLPTISNQSNASISGSAKVTASTGNVTVNATAKASVINVAGMAFSLDQLKDLNPGVSAGSSLGGSYAGVTLNNGSQADIGDNTMVSAPGGNVNVTSDTETFALDIVQAGDKAKTFGITGAFNWLNLNDNSEAYIQSDATVNAGQNVKVNATNNLSDFAITGALGTGGTVQVGVTTGWNQVDDTTLAYIGDPSNSRTSICAGCGVTAGGNVNVKANSSENIYAISLAAAKSGSSGEGADGESSSQPTGETAPSNSGSGTEGDNGAGGDSSTGKGGQYGFGISANIAFNQINNGAGGPGVTTDAFINNGASVSAGGDINLNAQDTSFAVAVGIAGSLGQTVALAGAYSQNSFIKQVEAYTENADVIGNGLSLTANDQGDLFDISAGGGVNTESGVAIAGSVNNNSITNTTEAYLGDGTTATGIGSDGITLNAQEGSASGGDKIVSVAGGFGIGLDGGGIGAGIDLGNYNNTVTASIESGADTGSSGNAQITANTNVFLLPIAVTFGFGSDFGAAGSFAYEQLTNNTTASIDGTLWTGSNLLLASNDTSNILIIGGGVGVGGDAGVGVTGIIPAITRKTTASIGDNANVTALGSDSSPLTYDSQTIVGALLDATSSGSLSDYAIAGGGGGVVGVAGAVILNPFFNSGNAADTLYDDTEATIGKNARVNGNNAGAASDQSVMLEASDSTGILDVAGALSIAADGAVGVGFDQVTPVWTVKSGIGSGSIVNAADNVVTSSTLDNSLQSYALAASGSADEVSVSGAGAASVLNVTTNTDSYINGNVLAGGNVEVAADRNTGSLNTVDGDAAVAISLGGGVGVSVGKITTNDTVDASIGGTADVTALGSNSLGVPNGQLDSNGNPETSPFQGVSVTAMSNTSTIPVAAGLAASGIFGGQGSVLVNNFTETTKAHIDSGAQVNVTGDGGANSNQSVQALATGDMSLFSTAGAVGGGTAALAAGVDTETLNRTVDAYISGATVNAADNVLVDGSMLGSITSLAIAGSAGGFAGDGAVSVINETTNTDSYIDGGAIVTADGSVGVLASRDTSLTTGDGSVALSGGVSANGSVSTVTKNDTVKAYVGGSGTSVMALGQGSGLSVPVDNSGTLSTASIAGLTVAATAQETLKTYAVGASISGGVGALSGSVTTNNITENTSAKIESGATINGNNAGAAPGQGVNVLASDKTNLTAVDGAIGATFDVGAGIGAALDFGNIQKTTVAGIDNGADVNAVGAVNVDALSSEEIDSYEAAVGGSIGAGLAGTTADYSTNPITTTTTAYVGSCTTSSSCSGGATVNAGSLGVDANDSLNFDVFTGELSVGGAALGAATLEVAADDNTSAFIGALSQIDTGSGGTDVNSAFGDNLSGTALAGSGGAVSGDAAFGQITDNSNNSASIVDGANVASSGDVGVTAKTTRNLSVTTGALSVGAVAAGAVISETQTDGSTSATIGNNVTLSAKDLDVSADDNSTASSSGTAVAAGIGSGQYNRASADLGGSVAAAIGNDANIGVTNNLTVGASGESNSSSDVFGVDAGGLTVGVAESEASATPTITASVGDNGTITAGNDLSLEATYTSSGVTASGSMSSGSLVNVGPTTSYAHANNSPTVSAVAGDSNNSSSTLSAGHDLTISSTSDTDAAATFNGEAFSGVNIPGNSEATANINNNNAVSIGPNATVAAGNDLLLAANSSNVIGYATVTGTNAGLVSLSTDGATANACIDSPGSCGYSGPSGGTSVSVASGDLLTAGDAATLQATDSDSSDDVNSTSTVAAAIGTNNNNANVTINANPAVSVSGGSVAAPTVTLESEVNKMLVSSEADSITAAADSYSTSNSTINVTGDPGVFLTGADISGPAKISITSLVSSDANNINTSGQATASINGFTGSITANSYNNTAYHPAVSIDPNSTMTTSDLEVNVNAPIVPNTGSNPYYSNIANPQNNTVVSWVLTTFQETVQEVVEWLPWPLSDIVEWVTKTVTEWVEQVTNSTTTGTAPPNFVSSPSLNINGTIYQPAGQNPVLVANPDGSGGVTFTTDTNVPVSVSGNDIVVGDLTNNETSAINLNVPNGTVSGNFTVHRNTNWTNIDITNNTGDNLVINGIQPASTNGSQPDVSVTAGDASGLSYNFLTDNSAASISIQNNSGSNVTLDGFINDPPGSLSVTNTDGNILGGPDNLSLINQLSLAADDGSIGSSTDFLNAQMESDNSSGASLSALAGGNLFLNATLVQNVSSSTDITNYTIPGGLNVDSIQAGGDANLNLGQPLALVDSVTFSSGGNTRTVTPEPVDGIYNVGDAVTADGDVNLTATDAPLYLYGLLQAGGTANITDTGNSIYNGGEGQLVQATDINLSAADGQIGTGGAPINLDLTGGSVNANASGDINLSDPAGDMEVGAITSSDGAANIAAVGSILDADNSGTTDISANNINLLAGGSIGADGNALIVQTPNAFNSVSGASTNVTQASGDFNIGAVTSTTGDVTLSAPSGSVNLGTVNSTSGTTNINASGSILDGDAAPGVSDINANNVNLAATAGTIGTDANPLQIDSSVTTPGLVNASAAGDVNLNETAGSLNVGSITSDAGNVNLTAPAGDVNLGEVTSTSGNTTITALGSILDSSGGADTNVAAINVNLTAQNGSIGATGDPVAIDSSNESPGQLTAWADQDVWITEVNGDLNVNTVTSALDNVNLDALAGDVNLGTVNATQGTATVGASGSILDGDAAPGVSDINANNINLTAGGSIGTDANPLQIDSSFSAPGLVSGWANSDVNLNETAGSLNVGTITSNAGNVNLTVPDGDTNLGTVNSTAGTTNITASGSILNAFGSSTGVANINAVNINLTAQNGSVGTNGTMLTINSSDASPGVVNGLAGLGVYLDQLSGPLNVDSIESETGDIVILSDGSILNAGTPDSYTPGVNLTGNNITLTSTNGGIGAAGNRLIVDNRNPDTITGGMADGSNYLDMSAQGDIEINEIGGNLLSHSISSAAGNIDLLASNGNGNLDDVIGNQNVTATVAGSLLDIYDITGSGATAQKAASPNNVSLTVETAGGTLNVNHMDVYQSVTTRADNTDLANVVHTNLADPLTVADAQTNGLHFDDAGSTGGIANNIDINVSPCAACTTAPPVIFDNYLTETGNVKASVDWLEFINTIVGTSADFQNNWLNIQLTNKFAGSSKADTPWYLFMVGNHTAQDFHPIEFDHSTFLQQGVQPSYNQSIGTIFNDMLSSYGFRP